MDFDAKRKGTGTMEWADTTENICLGCANNCLYCYAAHNADRFGTKPRSEWANEEFTKRANIKSYPAKDGVIMFPSSHDITPFNVDKFIEVAQLMLAKGNKLLIVSKPRIECIEKIALHLYNWRNQILFRFTIGSINAELCAFWEPGASTPKERIECLQVTNALNYSTSVSIEPMLSGVHSAIEVVKAVDPHVTDTIWIGKMNKADLRITITNSEIAEAISLVHSFQRDELILWMYEQLKDNPKIRWKDSINVVLKNHNKI